MHYSAYVQAHCGMIVYSKDIINSMIVNYNHKIQLCQQEMQRNERSEVP